jgi:energy-coupling factor transport system permease protein
MFSRLPGDSPLQRIWVGTKLASLAMLTVAVLFNPAWTQVVSVAAVTAIAVLAARVPRSAVPRLPMWYWIPLLVGLGLAFVGHGARHYLNLIALTVLFTVMSALVVWTTSMHDLAPALGRLGRPLARLGLPVAEWAAVTALAVRCLPLLLQEFRTLLAARRQRRLDRRANELLGSLVDVLTAAMVVTIRRASDLGAAVTARGGDPSPNHDGPRPGRGDAVTLLIVTVACVLPAVLTAVV